MDKTYVGLNFMSHKGLQLKAQGLAVPRTPSFFLCESFVASQAKDLR